MVFVSFRNIFSDNRRDKTFIILSRKAQIFFPEFNIRLYDKNSESDYFFFLHQIQNIFFEKKHNPPPSQDKEKKKAQHNMYWTPLDANKHK